MYIELLVFFVSLLFFVHMLKGHESKCRRLPPGPVGIPIFGYLPFMGKIPCKTVSTLAKKYGKLMTIQMGQYPVVFVNDLKTAKTLYKLEVMSGRAQLELFKPRGYYGLGLLEGKDWSEFRRFMMTCLRDLGFGKKSMEASIMEEVIEFRKLLANCVGKSIYLKPLLEIVVINAIWGLLTGEKYDIQDPLKQRVAHIMSDGLASQNIVGIATFLPWLAKLFPGFSGYTKGMEYFGAPDELARDIMHSHIQTYSATVQRDWIDAGLSRIYQTTDPTSQFYGERGVKNLHYTIIDLFFAGSDTMSSTLGWTFLYLALYPSVQKKINLQIQQVIGKRLPTLEDRQRLPYVEATMAEILRKSSLVPFGLFHTPIRDFHFEEYLFPKGTFFLTNLHHIHQDPEYWGDPEIFRPERFLSSDGKFRRDDHLIPFFTGQRTCPAEGLAMMEYFLFFVGILQVFEFQIDPSVKSLPDLGPRAGFILTPPCVNLVVRLHKDQST